MENNTNDILREQEEVGGLNQVIDSATADEDVSVREDFTANASGVELTSLRGANWKVFDMGHGRRQAIYYAEPVCHSHKCTHSGWFYSLHYRSAASRCR